MYTSFMNNQVPALWTRVSFASLKSLASWNKDLLFRCEVDLISYRSFRREVVGDRYQVFPLHRVNLLLFPSTVDG